MQKSILEKGFNLLSQAGSLSSLWSSQVRHAGGHARRLAIARDKVKKMRWYLKLPYLATSRNVVEEDANSIERIAESKDGRVIACWHPEPPFPYEMTKPIPLDVTPTHSALKVQALMPVREVFNKKHRDVVVRELMQLTYTAKYRWYCVPKRRARLIKMDVKGLNAERDRDYL